jgi:hypothetical protein
MIQEGLRVAVPLKDKTLSVVAVEVQLVLQSPGVFNAHQFRAFRCETLKLVKLAIMDFESRQIEVRSLILPPALALRRSYHLQFASKVSIMDLGRKVKHRFSGDEPPTFGSAK